MPHEIRSILKRSESQQLLTDVRSPQHGRAKSVDFEKDDKKLNQVLEFHSQSSVQSLRNSIEHPENPEALPIPEPEANSCWNALEAILPSFLFKILTWFKDAFEALFLSPPETANPPIAETDNALEEESPLSETQETATSLSQTDENLILQMSETIQKEVVEWDKAAASARKHTPSAAFLCKVLFVIKLTLRNGPTDTEETPCFKHIKLYSKEKGNRGEFSKDIWDLYDSLPETKTTNFEMAFVSISQQPGGRLNKTNTQIAVTQYNFNAEASLPNKRYACRLNLPVATPIIQSFPLLKEAGISTKDFIPDEPKENVE